MSADLRNMGFLTDFWSDVGWAVLPASRPTGRLVYEAFVELISPLESGLAGTTAHPTSLLTALMQSIACKLG